VILAVLFIDIFATHANIGWVFLNIGGGYSNIGGGYSNKTSEFWALFCTNWHAKSAKSLFFDYETPVLATFATFSLFHLIPPPAECTSCTAGIAPASLVEDTATEVADAGRAKTDICVLFS
jgi:hypothetical protein